MPKTEAALKAQRKYAQSEKGKTAIKKARQKHNNTEEYREYHREKQKEYRRRRKLEATESGADPQNTKVEVEAANLVPLVLYARTGVEPKVEAEIKTALRSLPNRSEFIRDAVIEKLLKEGLLPADQNSGSRGAA